jgi:hypothetical protein
MNESFDVAAIPVSARLALPHAEADGVATPKGGKRVTRVAAEGDRGPRPAAFAARDHQTLDNDDADQVLPRLWGASPDHLDAGVSQAVGDVAYLAWELEENAPALVTDGDAGGPSGQTTRPPRSELAREDE